MLGEAHWNHPPWPGTMVTICMSCFRTGGPGKEHGTDKPPPTGRVQKGQKETTYVWPPPRILLAGIHLGCTTRKDSETEWLAKDNLETNPITIKPKPCGTAVLLGSLTLLLSTCVSFPNKIFCFVSTCVSLDSSFLSVRQESNFGAWKVSPFLQHLHNLINLGISLRCKE